MPDILIRGWDVPQGCDSCQLNKGGRGCPITGTQYEGDTWVMMDFDEHAERLPDCPLHELPDHGDLIDRDTAIEESKKPTIFDLTDVPDFLHEQSIIIPSNKENKNAN